MQIRRFVYGRLSSFIMISVIIVSILSYAITVNPVLGLPQLLVDSDFNDSIDSGDLIANGTGQDWYESRNDNPSILTLDTANVGGNSGKKAKLTQNTTSSAYMSQEFNSAQTDFFMAQWDIYVDDIANISAPDRAGWMLIGDDSNPTRPGPNSDDNERFVYMAFYKDGGGSSGTMDLAARDNDDAWTSFTTVATGLNLKQWYTIKVICNITSDKYDVYVNEAFKATVSARTAKASVTHMSFAQWNDGAGTFYVDNVIAATLPTIPTISVTPTNITTQVDSEFSVNITLDYAQRLYGFEVWLSFDNSKLNATTMQYWNYLNEPTMQWYSSINNTGGYLGYARSSQHPAIGKTGGSPPPLLSVTFKCVGTGNMTLHLYKTILSDDQARPITHNTSDANVECKPSLVYDDLIFDSSFEMGNLINVAFQEGNSSGYRYYTAELNYSTATFPDKHWWFCFSVQNTTGKTVKIELKNLAAPDFTGLPSPGIPRWPDIEPVYSYDNTNWLRIPDENYNCGNNETRNFNITLSPTQSKVWVAPIPPYTVTMMNDFFASYESNPYLNVSSLGTTPLGQNLKVATITDPAYPDTGKFKIYVTAQQHSGETVASFVTEGLMKFLIDETDPVANKIRQSYIFRLIPIMNVEGVYYGISRYTPFRSGAQRDMNRAWAADPISITTSPEVNWTFTDIQNWMPDAFLDMHSEINGESGSQTSIDCFFLHDGLYDDLMINFCNNVSRGFDGTQDYWPETGSRSATGSTMAATNVRARLGVHPSADMEHPHDDLRNSTAHPVDHNPQAIADWKDWGRRIALGIFDYYGEVEYPDLITEDTVVLTNDCAIFANDTYVDDTPYYYPVEVTVTNNGTADSGAFYVKLDIYWINGSLTEATQEIQVLNLTAGTNTMVNFTSIFNPTHLGYYRLILTVDSRNEVFETDETNNLNQIDNVKVTIIGDINSDQTVNILDATVIGLAWNAVPSDPQWNIKADINHDGEVNSLDATRLSAHWRESWS